MSFLYVAANWLLREEEDVAPLLSILPTQSHRKKVMLNTFLYVPPTSDLLYSIYCVMEGPSHGDTVQHLPHPSVVNIRELFHLDEERATVRTVDEGGLGKGWTLTSRRLMRNWEEIELARTHGENEHRIESILRAVYRRS